MNATAFAFDPLHEPPLEFEVMRPRTRRQREIYDYIADFVESHGHDPSYNQIAFHFDVRSKGGIAKHIEALESQGLLKRHREGGRFRLELNPQENIDDLVYRIDWLTLPEDSGHEVPEYDLIVPKSMTGILPANKLRGFMVPDDAMLDAHIKEGDIALIEKKSFARDRDCVVAAVPENGVIMSGFRRAGAEVEFRPANEKYDIQRFSADEITILGVFRALIRPAN